MNAVKHPKQKRNRSIASVILAAFLGLFLWSTIVSGDTLSWQWKAGRDTKYVLAATITAIDKADAGFLGIGASPSMAGALPDAIVVSFKRLDAGALTSIPGAFKLRMPRVELGTLSVGDSVKLDLIDDDVCVGVKLAPVTK